MVHAIESVMEMGESLIRLQLVGSCLIQEQANLIFSFHLKKKSEHRNQTNKECTAALDRSRLPEPILKSATFKTVGAEGSNRVDSHLNVPKDSV